MELTDKDIRNNPFSYNEKQLLYNLSNDNLSLRIVSRYQKLTAYMCAKYVIFGGNDEKYGDCCEDRWLDDNDILRLQPHITREELSNAHTLVYYEEMNEEEELYNMGLEDKKYIR